MLGQIKSLPYFPQSYSKRICQFPFFCIKARPINRGQKQNEIERCEYKKLMKEYRKEHKRKFWEVQTKIENKYIEDYREQQKQKEIRDMQKYRTSVCKISMHTHNHLVYLYNSLKCSFYFI
jgi:hypothetical protein